jgi:hypothetical protein
VCEAKYVCAKILLLCVCGVRGAKVGDKSERVTHRSPQRKTKIREAISLDVLFPKPQKYIDNGASALCFEN